MLIMCLELRSGFKGFLNYHIGSKWNYNQVKQLLQMILLTI
jgi:hypothetical protein